MEQLKVLVPYMAIGSNKLIKDGRYRFVESGSISWKINK